MASTAVAVCAVLCLASVRHEATAASKAPEQVAIAATETVSRIVVTWVTFDPTETSEVRYGLKGEGLTHNATGTVTKFVDRGLLSETTRYVHRANMTGLLPLSSYDYVCGSALNWSQQYTVHTIGGDKWAPTFAVYGDMGSENAVSLPWLVQEATEGGIDGVLHVGDIAYDLFSKEGVVGDEFMNQIEPIATQVPYMVCPGNHEWLHNFTHYKNRFSMPGTSDNYYYSWDAGHAHIISFSTEVYYFQLYGLDPVIEQYHWLEQELQRATSPEQRALHPWIITMGHRPMYCSTTDGDDCNNHDTLVRVGLYPDRNYGLEKLFYDYGVDVCLWGHEHNYERLWPIYNTTVMNGSHDSPYTNPKAPVHIITGSAGCREGHSQLTKDRPEWLAFTNSDYGYSKLSVLNSTHLSLQQISTEQGGKIVDSITVIKESHGPYEY